MVTHLQKAILALVVAILAVAPLLPAVTRLPKPKPVVLPPPSSHWRDPLLGMHGRMTDEVEKWKIDQTVHMIGNTGASWLIEYFPWAYMEPARGEFDWEHADIVVHAAASRGLKVIARLDMVPDWARPVGSTSRYLGEDRYEDYARFAGAFAARYRGAVKGIVVWNEPNLSFEWGYRPVDPAAYTRLLKAAYRPIKNADRGIAVIAAGLAPTLDTNEWALSDLVYLQRMYEAGAKPYFDQLAVHAYGWRSPPDDPAAPDRINFARTELLRQIMVANGDERKKIVITESGWNDHPRWIKAVRPSQRIEYSLRALDKVASEWPWVQSFSFWSFKLPRDVHNYNDYFTFLKSDFRPKPIYEAFLQRAASQARQAGKPAPPGVQ